MTEDDWRWHMYDTVSSIPAILLSRDRRFGVGFFDRFQVCIRV